LNKAPVFQKANLFVFFPDGAVLAKFGANLTTLAEELTNLRDHPQPRTIRVLQRDRDVVANAPSHDLEGGPQQKVAVVKPCQVSRGQPWKAARE
jgi:hypothetical protein